MTAYSTSNLSASEKNYMMERIPGLASEYKGLNQGFVHLPACTLSSSSDKLFMKLSESENKSQPAGRRSEIAIVAIFSIRWRCLKID